MNTVCSSGAGSLGRRLGHRDIKDVSVWQRHLQHTILGEPVLWDGKLL
jgi:hypothetical protein